MLPSRAIFSPPALYARMTVQPDTARRHLCNDLIRTLKSSGVWPKLGVLYVMAAHDEQAALINFKDPGGVIATAVNAPTFTVDRGFTGNIAGLAHVTSNLAFSTIPSYQQDSAHAGAWCLNNPTAAARFILGQIGGTATLTLNPRNTSDNLTVHMNGLPDSTTIGITTSVGHLVTSRLSSADFVQYKNGTSLATITNASTGIAPNILCFLRQGSTYSAHQIAVGHVGAGLTAIEEAALYNALLTYMQAVGAAYTRFWLSRWGYGDYPEKCVELVPARRETRLSLRWKNAGRPRY
jgi:hypothetical protein